VTHERPVGPTHDAAAHGTAGSAAHGAHAPEAAADRSSHIADAPAPENLRLRIAGKQGGNGCARNKKRDSHDPSLL